MSKVVGSQQRLVAVAKSMIYIMLMLSLWYLKSLLVVGVGALVISISERVQ